MFTVNARKDAVLIYHLHEGMYVSFKFTKYNHGCGLQVGQVKYLITRSQCGTVASEPISAYGNATNSITGIVVQMEDLNVAVAAYHICGKHVIKVRYQLAMEPIPDSKVHGANMGPTWVLPAPDVPHFGPMNLSIRDGLGWRSMGTFLVLLFSQMFWLLQTLVTCWISLSYWLHRSNDTISSLFCIHMFICLLTIEDHS